MWTIAYTGIARAASVALGIGPMLHLPHCVRSFSHCENANKDLEQIKPMGFSALTEYGIFSTVALNVCIQAHLDLVDLFNFESSSIFQICHCSPHGVSERMRERGGILIPCYRAFQLAPDLFLDIARGRDILFV